MKFLKWLVIIIAGLFAVLFVGGLLISPQFTVVRSVTIDAPPSRVFQLVADPRMWTQWTVWNQRDPAMDITYSGAASGAGAGWAWKSKTEGEGRMTFTTVEPERSVAYELYFPDFETTSTGTMALQPQGNGTQVTWTMNGDFGPNPLYRWFALGADGMIGPDFEAGLANLKALAEKPAQ